MWFKLSGITQSLSYKLHNMVAVDLILYGLALVLLVIIEALILVNLHRLAPLMSARVVPVASCLHGQFLGTLARYRFLIFILLVEMLMTAGRLEEPGRRRRLIHQMGE